MIDSIFLGASAGIAANEAQRHINRYAHNETKGQDDVHALLLELAYDVQLISRYLKEREEKPIDMLVTLKSDPSRFKLQNHGRKHSYIFIPTTSTQIAVHIPGIGDLTLITSDIGWKQLDFPDGTELYLSSGTQQNILVRYTNDISGGKLF